MRKHIINQTYFNKINNQTKAYWLGYLYADGNVYFGKSKEYRLSLPSKDYEHLVQFNKCLDSEYPIYRIQDKKRNTYYYRIEVTSKVLTEALVKQGVVPRKTFIIKFPELRKDLIRHFIRGYFDGDGTIYIKPKKQGYYLGITSGSKQPLLQMKKILRESLKVAFYIYSIKKYHTLSMQGCRTPKLLKVYRYFYKNSSVFLERKRNKFKEILKI